MKTMFRKLFWLFLIGSWAIPGTAFGDLQTLRGRIYGLDGVPITAGTVKVEIRFAGLVTGTFGPANLSSGEYEFDLNLATSVIEVQLSHQGKVYLWEGVESLDFIGTTRLNLQIGARSLQKVLAPVDISRDLNMRYAASYPSGNLIRNSSFESENFSLAGAAPSGWVGRWGATIQRVEANVAAGVTAQGGRFILSATTTAQSEAGQHEGAKYILTEDDPAFPAIQDAVSRGGKITLSAWVRAGTGAAGKSVVFGNIHSQGDAGAFTFADNEWHRITYTFNDAQIHPNAFRFRYYGFSVHERTNSGDIFQFYLDNVVLAIGEGDASIEPSTAVSYLDGEGRALSTQLSSRESASGIARRIVTKADYDNLGRPWKFWLPFDETCQEGHCQLLSLANANQHYNGSVLPDAGGFAYSENIFEPDPSGRIFQSTFPGSLYSRGSTRLPKLSMSATSNLSETALGSDRSAPANTGNAVYPYVHQKDGSGRESMVWKDQLGNILKVSYPDGDGKYVSSYSVVNAKSQVVQLIPPISCKDPTGAATNIADCVEPSSVEFNQLGLVVREVSPDYGEVTYQYDAVGRLRASQNPDQLAKSAFTVIKYDELGRQIESGEFTGSLPSGTADLFGNIICGQREEDSPEKWSFKNINQAYSRLQSMVPTMSITGIIKVFVVVESSDDLVNPTEGSEFASLIDENGAAVDIEFIGVLFGSDEYGDIKTRRGGGLDDSSWPTAGSQYEVHLQWFYDDLVEIPERLRSSEGHPIFLPVGASPENAKGKLVSLIHYNPGLKGSFIGERDRLVANTFSYDESGNTVSEFQYIGTIKDDSKRIQEIEYEYDRQNRLVRRVVYKNGSASSDCGGISSSIRIAYDILGRPVKIFSSPAGICPEENELAAYSYNPDGKVREIIVGDGSGHQLRMEYAYHTRGWMSSIAAIHVCPAADPCAEEEVFSQTLKYDQNLSTGSVPQFDGAIAENIYYLAQLNDERKVIYRYDNLVRLTGALFSSSADPASTALSGEFGYMDDGRLKSLRRGGGEMAVGSYKFYPGTNRLKCVDGQIDANPEYQGDRSCIGESFNYSYDASGNLKSDREKDLHIEYDGFQNPYGFRVGSHLTLMAYDGNGYRVSKIDGAVSSDHFTPSSRKHYIAGLKELHESETDETIEEVNNLFGGLGRVLPDGTEEYFIKNHLGSTVTKLNNLGNWADQTLIDYFPFGKQVKYTDNDGLGLTPNYTGKEYDGAQELLYFGSRYFDPDVAVWTSPDPEGQFNSPYSYGDPVNGIDPDGNNKVKIVSSAVWHIVARHMATKGDKYAKYAKKTKFTGGLDKVLKGIEKTVQKWDRRIVQKNGRIRYEKDMGKTIGKTGETVQVVVTEADGTLVTSFPSATMSALTVSMGVFLFGDNPLGHLVDLLSPFSGISEIGGDLMTTEEENEIRAEFEEEQSIEAINEILETE